MVGNGLAEQAFAVRRRPWPRHARCRPGRPGWPAARRAKPIRPAATMMIGNGTAKKKIATKAAAASGLHRPALERAPADPDHRLDDDRQHGGLQAEEGRGDEADLPPQRVDDAERHQGDDAGQDEQAAGHEAAARAVHQPADIDGELLGLGSGQQHAVVQRMQEPALGDPPLLLDDDAVHHRDLPGRAAEAQGGDARPDATASRNETPCPEAAAAGFEGPGSDLLRARRTAPSTDSARRRRG